VVASVGGVAALSLSATVWSQVATATSGIVVARMLGATNRGYLALLVLWPTLLLLIGDLGLPMAVPYFLARDQNVFGSLTRRLLTPALFQCGILMILEAAILTFLLSAKPRSVMLAGILTALVIPSALCLEYCLALLQGRQRFLAFNLLRCLPATCYGVMCATVFLGLFRPQIALFAGAWSGSYALAAACGVTVLFLNRPSEYRSDDPPPLRAMVQFGLRGLFGSVSPIETFRLDQAIVGLALSPAALGNYVVALAFTIFPRLIAQAVGLVAYPKVAAQSEPSRARVMMLRFFVLGSSLALVVAVALAAIVGTLVPLLFGAGYRPAIPLARILLAAAFFLAARRLLTDGLRGTGRPGIGSVAEFASWFVLVPSLVLLVPRLGLTGVAVSFMVAALFSLLCLLAFVFGQTPRDVMPSRSRMVTPITGTRAP
jgi:O-antigen/teichoic acid export membrane protein